MRRLGGIDRSAKTENRRNERGERAWVDSYAAMIWRIGYPVKSGKEPRTVGPQFVGLQDLLGDAHRQGGR